MLKNNTYKPERMLYGAAQGYAKKAPVRAAERIKTGTGNTNALQKKTTTAPVVTKQFSKPAPTGTSTQQQRSFSLPDSSRPTAKKPVTPAASTSKQASKPALPAAKTQSATVKKHSKTPSATGKQAEGSSKRSGPAQPVSTAPLPSLQKMQEEINTTNRLPEGYFFHNAGNQAVLVPATTPSRGRFYFTHFTGSGERRRTPFCYGISAATAAGTSERRCMTLRKDDGGG